MEVIVLPNKEAVAAYVSDILHEAIQKNPTLVLGLATGKTMIEIYQHFVDLVHWRNVDLFGITTFNLDEYLVENKAKSFIGFMKHYLFKPLQLNDFQINFLSYKATDKTAEGLCKDYEKKILDAGGIDIQLLGIGRNGHIAFNEPGSSIKSRTRLVYLQEETRKDVVHDFGNLGAVPKKALTIGISTILETRKIILVATGKEKAEIIKKAIKGKVSETVPASFLQKHTNVLVVLDKEAGYLL